MRPGGKAVGAVDPKEEGGGGGKKPVPLFIRGEEEPSPFSFKGGRGRQSYLGGGGEKEKRKRSGHSWLRPIRREGGGKREQKGKGAPTFIGQWGGVGKGRSDTSFIYPF